MMRKWFLILLCKLQLTSVDPVAGEDSYCKTIWSSWYMHRPRMNTSKIRGRRLQHDSRRLASLKSWRPSCARSAYMRVWVWYRSGCDCGNACDSVLLIVIGILAISGW